jgi:hypothetical protein
MGTVEAFSELGINSGMVVVVVVVIIITIAVFSFE